MDIVYGLLMDNTKDDFLVNVIVVLCKFYIHKSKFMKVKPRFCGFHNEFLSYSKSLKVMKTKNAVKPFNIIEEYDLLRSPILLIVFFCLFVCLLSFYMHLFLFDLKKMLDSYCLYMQILNNKTNKTFFWHMRMYLGTGYDKST